MKSILKNCRIDLGANVGLWIGHDRRLKSPKHLATRPAKESSVDDYQAFMSSQNISW